MNDKGYVNLKYEESVHWKETEYCSERWRLKNKRPYFEMAVCFHRREQNPEQTAFFQAGLDHIDRKLESLKQ